jgi:signal transduction histidine kinase
MQHEIMAERARVAREIHDGLAQKIAALGYELDSLSTHPGVDPSARVETRRIRADLSETLVDLRNQMHHLAHDPISLRTEIESLFARLGISTHLTIGDDSLPTGTGWEIRSIIHEAVRNISQHSQATEVWCEYSATPEEVRLVIEDNGQGFERLKDIEFAGVGRRGIIGMRERAQLIGAELLIENRKSGSGFRIEFQLIREK